MRNIDQAALERMNPEITNWAALPLGTTVFLESAAAGDQPLLHLDDAQRAVAIGQWLAAQRFDPRGRTAQALSRLFAGRNFAAAARRLHMSFLSRSFPNIEDPVFPDDPRFNAHIRRP